jgi:hypothetical protein
MFVNRHPDGDSEPIPKVLDGTIAVIAILYLVRSALPETERRPDPAALRSHYLRKVLDVIGVLVDILVWDALTTVPPEMRGPFQEERTMTLE